jgi:hypothetical protein
MGSLLWVASTSRRAIDFFRAPAVDGELALVALVNIAIVLFVVGVLWQKQLEGTLIVAGAVGLATRVLADPRRLRLTWKAITVTATVLMLAAALGIAGGFVAAVTMHHWQAAPAAAPPVQAQPEIHISPCPSPDVQIGSGPAGSYVCLPPALATVPPDPGTGPVLAPSPP